MEEKSRVFILLDEHNRIIRCEGEYTLPSDLTDWVLIDEGNGDRYNLAQSHYFEGGLYTDNGCHRYVYEDGTCREATPEELAEELAIIQEPVIKAQEIATLKANLTNTDYVILKIAEGVATKEEYADILAQRDAWRKRINEVE